jgi:hypothetical protein
MSGNRSSSTTGSSGPRISSPLPNLTSQPEAANKPGNAAVPASTSKSLYQDVYDRLRSSLQSKLGRRGPSQRHLQELVSVDTTLTKAGERAPNRPVEAVREAWTSLRPSLSTKPLNTMELD